MAALEGGVINPSEALGAGSCIEAARGRREKFCNSGHTDYRSGGPGRSVEGLLGHVLLHRRRARQRHGNVIQNKAHELGIGRAHGDRPAERVPRRDPRPRGARTEPSRNAVRARAPRPPLRDRRRTGRPWTVGDNMHLAVGQGDLLTDPAADGGRVLHARQRLHARRRRQVVTPHLGMQIDESRRRASCRASASRRSATCT